MYAILGSILPQRLRILSVEYPTSVQLSHPLLPVDREYPSLLELTIDGPPSAACFRASFVAPRLQRLHLKKHDTLVHKRNTEKAHDLGQNLAHAFPCLTHLRLTAFSKSYIADPILLLRVFCQVTRATVKAHFSEVAALARAAPGTCTTAPPKLRRVIVDLDPSLRNSDTPYQFLNEQHTDWVNQYMQIVTAARTQGINEAEMVGKRSLVVLQPVTLLQESKVDWLQRATGTGKGCWI